MNIEINIGLNIDIVMGFDTESAFPAHLRCAQDPNVSNATTMESLDALKAVEEIAYQVQSEVSGVQLLLTKSKQVWLVSLDKDKVLAKHCQLGGFGSGQYAKAAECGDGVPYKLEDKDKTPVQVDETSLRESAATGSVATMTLYKLLVLTEREKSVTAHKVSYFNVSRKDDSSVEAGCDAFNVEPTHEMKFKILQQEGSEKVNCKSFFARCVPAVSTSAHIRTVFRFRFERVGLSLKVQKPYVITRSSFPSKRENL